jgi:hypothetical protein
MAKENEIWAEVSEKMFPKGKPLGSLLFLKTSDPAGARKG